MTRHPAATRLTAAFLADLQSACEAAIEARKRELVAAALGRLGPGPRAPASFPANPDGHRSFRVVLPFARPRKKAAVQMCPAPGCTARAASAYSMAAPGDVAIIHALAAGPLDRQDLAGRLGKPVHALAVALSRLKRKGLITNVEHGTWAIGRRSDV